ncbi:hypothetical protein [Halodesulfovibrio aestuarii]|uniref:hypothetical protein n=1 Tax=Halodesulfovibrio aestuarii TaxID=126333 RepID=UPI0004278CFF
MGRKKQSFEDFLATPKAERTSVKFPEQEFWRYEYTKRKFFIDMFYSISKSEKGSELPFINEASMKLVRKRINELCSVVIGEHIEECIKVREAFDLAASDFAKMANVPLKDVLIEWYNVSSEDQIPKHFYCDVLISLISGYSQWKYKGDPKYDYLYCYKIGGAFVSFNPEGSSHYLAAVEELHRLSSRYGYYPWVMINPKSMTTVYLDYRDKGAVYDPVQDMFLKQDSRKELSIYTNLASRDGKQYFEEEREATYYCYFNSIAKDFRMKKEVDNAFWGYSAFKKQPTKKSPVYGDITQADIQLVVEKEYSKSIKSDFCKTVRDSIVAYQSWFDDSYAYSKDSVLSLDSALVVGRDQTLFETRCFGLWMWDKVVFQNASKAEAMREVFNIPDPLNSPNPLFDFRFNCDERQLRRDFFMTQQCVENEKIVVMSKLS